MSAVETFENINEAKANLDHIYNQPDPRPYFHELRKLDYTIPDAAKPVFQTLLSCLHRRNRNTVHVLDLGCSYGVNAALLKHDLTMPELYEHWSLSRLSEAEPDEVVDRDRRFFDEIEKQEDIQVVGLDQAENAIAFAEEVGLLDEGVVADLETEPLSGPTKDELAPIDLVTSTGCVGYLTEKSFARLMPAITKGRLPWIANFVLRAFPFDDIDATLSEWGYVTEKLPDRSFIQRRFASADERDQMLQQLTDQGIDPTGKEADGHLIAEFYLSRPAEEAEEAPLETLFAA